MEKKLNEKKISLKRLRVLFLIYIALIGLIYSYVARHSITSDGISYIDMADRFLKTDYKALINGIWSPLYPFFLSVGFYFFKPNNYDEFLVVHVVNFAIYLMALFSFDFFLFSLLQYKKKQEVEDEKSDLISIPDWGLISVGYSLFLLSSLNIMGLWGSDPDICLSIFIYLIVGILFKITSGKSTSLNFAFLGLLLGFGYLAKAPMFPLAFLFLALCYYSNKSVKNILPKIVLSLFVFALIISPYVLALSKYKGHLTVGESGKLNYAWYVNNVPLFVNFQGDENVKLIHPTRKIYSNPSVYEFGEPLFGTYPPWTDPTYWYEGVNVHFDLIRQLSVISFNSQIHYDIFFKLLGFLLTGVLILLFIADKKDLLKYKILLIPSLFAFVMFSSVHLEPRYIGGFIPLFFLGILSAVKFSKQSELIVEKIVTVILLMLMLTIGIIDGREISAWVKNGSEHIEWNIANELTKFGIKEGDKVATIGYAIPYSPYWARVAKVKIVSEIMEKDSNDFFNLDGKKREEVLSVFKSTGAKIVVINKLPAGFSKDKLHKLPNNLFAYLLIKE